MQAVSWKNKTLAALATMSMVKFQLRRLSIGRSPQPDVSRCAPCCWTAAPGAAVQASTEMDRAIGLEAAM